MVDGDCRTLLQLRGDECGTLRRFGALWHVVLCFE
jgi:hypothetical protein